MKEAIVGVIGTLLGTVVGFLLNNWQVKKEKEKSKLEEEQKKELTQAIISKMLVKEIEQNYSIIERLNIYPTINERIVSSKENGKIGQYSIYEHNIEVIKFEDLKWDVYKNCYVECIAEIIDIYDFFYMIKRGFDTKNLTDEKLKWLSTMENRIPNLIQVLNNKEIVKSTY